MLPEQLSNGLCSINPDVDRLCMVCEMKVDNAGNVTAFDFFNGVMRSHARLIYDDVAALLKGDTALRTKYAAVVPHLEELHRLFNAFLRQRKNRGAIEFETTETVIEFGEGKKIDRIVPLQRNDAHRMIEECMIAANISAAKYLEQHEMPTLFRVHETPKQEKLVDLRAFLQDLGISLPGGDKPEAKHYAAVLEQVRDRPDWHLIQTVLLRSMNQAVYSPDNVGHFGLALENYAHFTSPIRRYPDLLVHRALKHCIKKRAPDSFVYNHDNMVHLGESCSMTERRADDATRDVVDWLKCEYMMDKVGDVFEGVVTGVTGFGMFVELDDIYVEGLVHITALKKDYYRFDPAKHSLIGERTNDVYRLADKVEVKVVRVDLDEKRIDFELAGLVSHAETGGGEGRNRNKGKRGGKGRKDKKPARQAQDSPASGSGSKKKARKKKTREQNTAQDSAPDQAGSTNKPGKKKRRRRKPAKNQASNKQTTENKTADKPASEQAVAAESGKKPSLWKRLFNKTS
jgi:ribonuclease R